MLLKELLKSKGIKQKWLADRIGVSEVTHSNWVSGKSVPKKEHLIKISEVFQIPLETLINE
ncbi:MAG: helix-turn-helix transcriptional regulator [Bacteroidales bacterium]|nr:helix-turn-helix transcriptional regulator [Bacteroidales bacterium]MCF8336433.1 helix-turn-helix transcriptional regulator [Bacteroidales bacterium]